MQHPTEDRLQAYLDGELTGLVTRRVERHVAACEGCTEAISGLRRVAGVFSGAMHRLDAAEPAHWPAIDTAERPAQAVIQVRAPLPIGATRPERAEQPGARGRPAPRLPSVPPALRWAAGIVLVAAVGTSAAAIGLRGGWWSGRAVAPAVDGTGSAVDTGAPGAAVAVRPVDGEMDVILTGAAVGSRVLVEVVESADVAVEVTGAAPRFQAGDGRVVADLAGRAAVVRVRMPDSVRAGTIRVDGRILVRTEGGRVTPPEAAGAGVVIGARP